MSEPQNRSLEDIKIAHEQEMQEFINAMQNGSEKDIKLLQYVINAPKTYQRQYMLHMKGELSRPKSLKLKCIECSGWSLDEAKRCHIKACPLWNYRPK